MNGQFEKGKDDAWYLVISDKDDVYKKLVDIFESINISDGINVDMSDKSKECMLCHYWYFLDKSFSYGPYLCDGCYNMMQKSNKLKNIAIVHIKRKCKQNLFSVYE